jgi:hypothetical protein
MSDSSTTHFLLAAFVAPDERLEMDRDARGNPEALAEIASSDTLRAALDSAGSLGRRELDDALLAYVALGNRPDPSYWQRQIRERILRDPEAAARLTEIEGRAFSLQQGANPEAHFERLTGHKMGAPSTQRWKWIPVAATVLILMTSGIAMRIMEDPVARAVWMQYSETGPTRGAPQETSDLVRARSMAGRARTSILGLWPRYDHDLLERAEELLAGRADPAAVLERGRIQLIRGQKGRARRTLESLDGTGVAGAESRNLLRLLAR